MNVDVKITSHTLSNKEGEETQYVTEETLCGVSPTHSDHGQEHVLCGTIQRSTVSAESVRATRVAHRRWVERERRRPRDRMPENRPFVYATSKAANYTHAAKSDRSFDSSACRNHHATHQVRNPTRLESTSTSPCTTSTSTSHCLSCSGSDLSPMRRYLKPFVEVVRWPLHRRRARGCAYECYRLGIYDRPSAMCYHGEHVLTGVQRVLQQ
jgi:hypothetical protein